MFKKKMLILLVLVIAGSAYADCVYKGRSYSEGYIRGPYICINGKWFVR